MTPGQVDDGKPAKTEADRASDKVALVVGTAVRDRVRHAHDRLALHWLASLEVKLPGYAAHCLLKLMTEDED